MGEMIRMEEKERVAEGAQNLFRVSLFRQGGESRHSAEWVLGMLPEFAHVPQVQVRSMGITGM